MSATIQTSMFPDLVPDTEAAAVRYHPLTGRPIVGSYSAHRRCDSRCLYARGPQCECQCSGKNHGRGYLDTPPGGWTLADEVPHQ